MLTSILTMDDTLSMAQESVPSAMLGCMVAMLECISMLHVAYYACDATS